MIEELYNKIDKFCNETDWSKYLTYEHALEEFIKEIVEEETKELQKENAELKKKNLDIQDAVTMQMYTNKANKEIAYRQLTKAKEIIRSLYFIIQGRIDYKGNIPLEDEMYRANQFLNSEVEK